MCIRDRCVCVRACVCSPDKDLVTLLTLADEYQADQVKARCQDYIGSQLFEHYRRGCATSKTSQTVQRVQQSFTLVQTTFRAVPPALKPTPWINQLTLYLWMCDQYDLPRYRAEVMSLLVEAIGSLNDVAKDVHYRAMPLQSRVDLLEALCRKLDGSKTSE